MSLESIYEKYPNIKSGLKDYTYIDHTKPNADILKENYLVRYITNTGYKYTCPKAGRITKILLDNTDPEYIYKILYSSGGGRITPLIIKNADIYLFYRKKSSNEIKVESHTAWFKTLSPYERRKFNEMRDKQKLADNPVEKKRINTEYYIWLYERHPERKPQGKNKSKSATKIKSKTTQKEKSKTVTKIKSKKEKSKTVTKEKSLTPKKIVKKPAKKTPKDKSSSVSKSKTKKVIKKIKKDKSDDTS
jgi:hypothetical protein